MRSDPPAENNSLYRITCIEFMQNLFARDKNKIVFIDNESYCTKLLSLVEIVIMNRLVMNEIIYLLVLIKTEIKQQN